jgi:sulfide:quinone oxidoreductase
MELYELTDELLVGGQIGPDTIPFIASHGIRAIICNRFDGEESGQPSFQSVEQAAAAHGIKAVSQPVLMPPNEITDEEAAAFGRLLEELPKPVLAYCRSGSRCAILWALSEARSRPFKEVVLAAMGAGYDLTRYVPRFQSLYRR